MGYLSLPDQSIPQSKKNKEWHIEHARSFALASQSFVNDEQKQEMLKYYRGYNAELSKEETEMVKHVTCPNGIDMGLEYIVYPLIQTKIEQIVGEFMLRPLRRKAYVIDKKSKNQKYEEKLKMLGEELMRELTEKMETDLGFIPDTENPQMELPEDIEDFFEKDFKMVAEEVADGLLTIFLDVRKEKHKLKELFIDYAIVDRCHVVLDKKHGHTTMRKVHPLDAEYDIDPYKVIQDNHEYFYENYWLTENEIYNTFSLSSSQKKEVKKMFEAMSNPKAYGAYDSEDLSYSERMDGWVQTSNKVNRLRVIHCMWKSQKNVSIKISENKEGRTFYKKLDDDDEGRKNDKIEKIEGEEPRFVYMLGPDICLDWGLMEQRFSYNETPWLCSLPALSIIRDNSTGSSLIKSVAAKLYQLQSVASELLFEIRLAIKHAGDSRVLVYDAAQTPKAFTKGGYENGLNRVMHHVKKDKFMVINTKEKGASKQSFNQFTSLDLSSRGALQDLFNGLAIIEDLASKFVGISPEREGQVGQYQTATGTDKAIRGSTARTEVIYTPFDEFIQALLDKVLLKAKQDYEEGEVIHFILGDMKSKFLKLFDDFFFADLGIYLSDPRKDKEVAERIDASAEIAMSQSSAPEIILGMIEVFEADHAHEKKEVFKRMLKSLEEVRQQNMQAEQQAAEAKNQADAQKAQEEAQLKREGYEKDIQVAEIYARNKSDIENMRNMTQERIELAKLAEQRSNEVRSNEQEQRMMEQNQMMEQEQEMPLEQEM